MAEPFLSEIRIMSFNFPPKGWASCNGQLLPINQNQALFALLGTTYGGNGTTTFALPDLRRRVPIHVGANHALGERAGTDSVTLTLPQLPAHNHAAIASASVGDTPAPAGALLGGFNNGYRAATALTTLAPTTVGTIGGSQAHENRQPFLALNYCIALQGIFPSPN